MNAVRGKFKNRTLCKMRKECGTRHTEPVRLVRVLHPPRRAKKGLPQRRRGHRERRADGGQPEMAVPRDLLGRCGYRCGYGCGFFRRRQSMLRQKSWMAQGPLRMNVVGVWGGGL